MASSLSHVSPEKDGGSAGGGGPEDSPRFAEIRSRNHGLLSLAFGFALGVALLVLFGLINWLKPGVSLPVLDPEPSIHFLLLFLFGFLTGTVVAAIYNFLVLQRLNIFGIESRLD